VAPLFHIQTAKRLHWVFKVLWIKMFPLIVTVFIAG